MGRGHAAWYSPGSVSLPATTVDKRPFQAAISENVRACRYYVQVLEDNWGPPELNFEREYALATQCVADPAMPMQAVAVLSRSLSYPPGGPANCGVQATARGA